MYGHRTITILFLWEYLMGLLWTSFLLLSDSTLVSQRTFSALSNFSHDGLLQDFSSISKLKRTIFSKLFFPVRSCAYFTKMWNSVPFLPTIFFFSWWEMGWRSRKGSEKRKVSENVCTHIHTLTYTHTHIHSHTCKYFLILGQKKIRNITWPWSFFFSQRGNWAPS